MVGASINEGAPARFDDQVTRILLRAQVFGVDGEDAIVEGRNMRAFIQAW